MVERIDALLKCFWVPVHDKIDALFGSDAVPSLIHLAKLPGRIDVQQRERQRTREEGLPGEVKHHRRILAHREKHHRARGLRHGLAQDEDALRFQAVKMRQVAGHWHRVCPLPGSKKSAPANLLLAASSPNN